MLMYVCLGEEARRGFFMLDFVLKAVFTNLSVVVAIACGGPRRGELLDSVRV